MKIVPLLIGSGPAERTWKDVGQIFTKNRNRLGAYYLSLMTGLFVVLRNLAYYAKIARNSEFHCERLPVRTYPKVLEVALFLFKKFLKQKGPS